MVKFIYGPLTHLRSYDAFPYEEKLPSADIWFQRPRYRRASPLNIAFGSHQPQTMISQPSGIF